jgi:hypothetical protein
VNFVSLVVASYAVLTLAKERYEPMGYQVIGDAHIENGYAHVFDANGKRRLVRLRYE